MKPFNLEQAAAGNPVITRNGEEVRIICHDRADNDGYAVIGLAKVSTGEEVLTTYTKSGKYCADQSTSRHDLFMAPITVTRWANLYWKHGSEAQELRSGKAFESETQARNEGKCSKNYVATIPFTYEVD